MSQEFRFRSDEFDNRDSDKQPQEDNPHYRVYSRDGNLRNFAITWPDGTSKSYPYAFLVKLEYFAEDGRVVITMTSDKIIMHGIRLKSLFNDLFYQLPLEITVIEKRYNLTSSQLKFVVNEITVIA